MSLPPDVATADDPFHGTADPGAYVRRDSCERALEELCAGLGSGRQLFVLHGPPGFGKTLLLRLLPQRLQDAARLVYVPYGALEPPDLCALVLGQLEREGGPAGPRVPGRTPEDTLVAHAQALYENGVPLVIAVDDASALAPESVRRLVQLARQSEGALRWIVVPIDDARAGRVVAALGLDVVDVRLRAPLDRDETENLVEGCLDRGDASPTLRERFDVLAIDRLHLAAGGSPRRLLMLASHYARGDDAALDRGLDDDEEEAGPELDAPDAPLETDSADTDELSLETDAIPESPEPPEDPAEPDAEPEAVASEPISPTAPLEPMPLWAYAPPALLGLVLGLLELVG